MAHQRGDDMNLTDRQKRLRDLLVARARRDPTLIHYLSNENLRYMIMTTMIVPAGRAIHLDTEPGKTAKTFGARYIVTKPSRVHTGDGGGGGWDNIVRAWEDRFN
jgi:hypothetical protein